MTTILTTFLLAIFVGAALLVIGVSLPLIKGKISRNDDYGFRTAKSLSDDAYWYPANRYGGKMMAAAGIVQLLAAIGFYFTPGIGDDIHNYPAANVIVTLVTLLSATGMSMRYIKRL